MNQYQILFLYIYLNYFNFQKKKYLHVLPRLFELNALNFPLNLKLKVQ